MQPYTVTGFDAHEELERRRRQRHRLALERLERWLRANPRAWDGWPTFDPIDWQDEDARYKRLRVAGFASTSLSSGELVSAANSIIGAIRNERRRRYEKNVSREFLRPREHPDG
jgi:hypothetical protein